MTKQDQRVCPGCSRHCPLDAVRCRYGRKFVQKHMGEATGKKQKWKKAVARGGVVFRLLAVSKQLKKALRNGWVTEAVLLGVLSDQEQEMLAAVTERLSRVSGKPSAEEK